jgi:hypothetical protein
MSEADPVGSPAGVQLEIPSHGSVLHASEEATQRILGQLALFDPKRPFSEAAVKIQEYRDELDRSRWGSR